MGAALRRVWPLVFLLLLVLALRFPNASQASQWAYRLYIPFVTKGGAEAVKYLVNAPHLGSDYGYGQTAIFWFGQVSSASKYADVRVGYTDQAVFVHLAAFDRYLWYKGNPTPSDLTAWDAASIYLGLDGNSGGAPSTSDYRFDAMLSWWEPRDAFQAAYRGDGSGWVGASVPFTSTAGWRGNAPNDLLDDRGWTMEYLIPFASLGMSGPPANGTVFRLGLAVHNRDDADSPPLPDQVWPPALSGLKPASWGQLHFGLPSRSLTPTAARGTVTIRQGLNGARVPDADVGGVAANQCPGDPSYIWGSWGQANWGSAGAVNIQNQGDVADWPCFSKYYVTFPLDQVPIGKAIISATLTLHQFGNSDATSARPSWIQILTTDRDWDESTISWNSAPLPTQNIGGAWVDPLTAFPGWPGVLRTWDVTSAVAQAYQAGGSARFILYDADWDYHSGKYFVSSDAADWNAEGRPTLQLVWGDR